MPRERWLRSNLFSTAVVESTGLTRILTICGTTRRLLKDLAADMPNLRETRVARETPVRRVSRITRDARIKHEARVTRETPVARGTRISRDARIECEVLVLPDARIEPDALIRHDARIAHKRTVARSAPERREKRIAHNAANDRGAPNERDNLVLPTLPRIPTFPPARCRSFRSYGLDRISTGQRQRLLRGGSVVGGGVARRVYRVLNRGVARLALFEKHADYEAFEGVMEEAMEEFGPERTAS